MPETCGPLDHCLDLVPLGSVTLAIKDGTHGTHARAREGVPFLSAKNISAAGTICWGEEDDRITESEYALIHQSFCLEDGDLLLTIVGSLGRRAIYRGERVTFQRSVAYVRPDTKRCSGRFLFHWFGHPHFQQELVRRSNATAQAGLYLGELAKVSVPKCPDKEQGQIASVLDTLDTTIRQTEAIIAKLKQVKQGLLHDLLTRGIDTNGELRPPQPQAPHLYKQSPLGCIPREWDVLMLGEAVEHVMDYRGRTPKKLGMDWGGGDILALSANNVQMGGIDTRREAYFGGEKLYRKWMTNGDPLRGDVLLTLEAPLGNVAQVPDDRPYILSQRVVLLRFRRGVAINNFAFWQIMSEPFQQAMVRRSTGTTATGIQRAQLVRIPVLIPPVSEQQLIDERLRAVEQRLLFESNKNERLRNLKSGLMDDLLTGRVRVTSLLSSGPS